MASEKQIQANKQNALLGGVKTPNGKRKSCLNSIKHGFFSAIITKQDKIVGSELCDEMHQYYSPQNILESQLVEILLSNLLAYRRICIIESKLLEKSFDVVTGDSDGILSGMMDSDYKRTFTENLSDELLKFMQYKGGALGLLLKTNLELERLKKAESL